MGQYDVKGEEDAIRAVLAGAKQLDDVVRTADEVAAGDDLAALFAQLFDAAPTPTTPAGAAATTVPASGLYADDVAYLDEALHAAFIDPTAPPSNDGVSWRRDTGVRHRRAGPADATSCSASRCCRRATSPTGGSPRSSCWPPRAPAARTGSTPR